MKAGIERVIVDEKALESAISQILEIVSDSIEVESKLNVKERPMEGYIINDTGALYRSIFSDKTSKTRKVVNYPVPYASELEFGGTHSAAYGEIYEWAIRKVGKTPEEARDFASAVVEIIETDGQIPRRFITDAVERTKQKIER